MKKYSVVSILLLFLCCAVCVAKKPKSVYLMGVSYSFSDSIVYFTEIQKIDSVAFDAEHKFLSNRQHYSYELTDYMAFKENMPGRPSAVFYAKKLSSLQKKEAKLKKKLLKKNRVVMYLGNKFSFTRP